MPFKNRSPHTQWRCIDCNVPLRDMDHPDDQRAAKYDSERCPWCWKQQINKWCLYYAECGNETMLRSAYCWPCAQKLQDGWRPPHRVNEWLAPPPEPPKPKEDPVAFGDLCGYCGSDLNSYRICSSGDCGRRYCRDCDGLVEGHQLWCKQHNEERWKLTAGSGMLAPPIPNVEAWEKFDIPWLGTADEYARGIDHYKPTTAQKKARKVQSDEDSVPRRGRKRKDSLPPEQEGSDETPAAMGDGAARGDRSADDSETLHPVHN